MCFALGSKCSHNYPKCIATGLETICFCLLLLFLKFASSDQTFAENFLILSCTYSMPLYFVVKHHWFRQKMDQKAKKKNCVQLPSWPKGRKKNYAQLLSQPIILMVFGLWPFDRSVRRVVGCSFLGAVQRFLSVLAWVQFLLQNRHSIWKQGSLSKVCRENFRN